VRKDEKAEVVSELQGSLEAADHLIVSGYRGLTVKAVTELRRAIMEAGGRMQVVKKTLLRRALAGRDEAGIGEEMEGPVAVTFVSGDATQVLKAMSAFAKGHEQLDFKGGWVEGQLFDGAQLTEIASLPPREELLSRLLTAMQAPMSLLAASLQAIPRDLMLTLMAVAEKQAGAAEA
jgi:large subunit ribosomal protein L10